MTNTHKLPGCFAALLLATVTALTLAPLAAKADPILGVESALSQVSVYANYLSQNYHESGSLDRELGKIPGGGLDFGYLAPPITGVTDLYLGGGVQYNSGQVNYHGSNLNTGAPINDNTNTRIENAFVEVGKGFYVGSTDFMLVPTVFWGQRDWNRDLVGDSEVEDYHTERVGAALHAALGLTGRLIFTGRIGVYDTLSPNMQLTSDGEYLKFNQESEPGVEAEAGLDYLLVGNWHLKGAVDLNAFTFGQSNLVPISATEGLREPTSSTLDISVKVGIGYGF